MSSSWFRVVEIRAPRRALEPGVQTALGRLGYRLISPAERNRQPPSASIVNDSELAEVPDDATPILLLTRSGRHRGDDPRIVGVLPRPADLLAVYQVLQNALEEHPREVPRVQATLAARCVEDHRNWPGAILSISEKGCLLRSVTAPASPGVKITFALPAQGLIQVTAEPRGHRGGDTGLFFREISDRSRAAIADFVAEMLMS